MKFPIDGEIIQMFQTTNQVYIDVENPTICRSFCLGKP